MKAAFYRLRLPSSQQAAADIVDAYVRGAASAAGTGLSDLQARADGIQATLDRCVRSTDAVAGGASEVAAASQRLDALADAVLGLQGKVDELGSTMGQYASTAEIVAGDVAGVATAAAHLVALQDQATGIHDTLGQCTQIAQAVAGDSGVVVATSAQVGELQASVVGISATLAAFEKWFDTNALALRQHLQASALVQKAQAAFLSQISSTGALSLGQFRGALDNAEARLDTLQGGHATLLSVPNPSTLVVQGSLQVRSSDGRRLVVGEQDEGWFGVGTATALPLPPPPA
jgi:hypothetical protein